MQSLFWISILGVLGVLSRYGVDLAFARLSSTIPVGTLLINVLGSFLAGLIYAIGATKGIPSALQTGLLVGFCGGFTTFSAYSLQAVTMLERGKVLAAFAYLAASPILGLIAALLPLLFTRRFLV
jgi:fluoride exporter